MTHRDPQSDGVCQFLQRPPSTIGCGNCCSRRHPLSPAAFPLLDKRASISHHHAADGFRGEPGGIVSMPTLTHPSLYFRVVNTDGVTLPRFLSVKILGPHLSGSPAGRHSCPGFLKSPTNSRFFESTDTTGCPACWKAHTCRLMVQTERCDRDETIPRGSCDWLASCKSKSCSKPATVR